MKYAPFYDQGKQIGWQSEDLSTVVGMEHLPADAQVDMPQVPFGSAQAATTNDPMALLPPGAKLDQPSAGTPSAPMSGDAAPDPYKLLPKGAKIDGIPFEQQLDKKRGSPSTVRAMVGSAPDQDRLTQIRQYYPDAEPYGDDNFVYRHPDTGRPTLYNPPGFDAGDIPSVGREITSAVGSMVGAGAAAVSAPFTAGAGIAAIPLGAGAGASVGAGLYDAARGLLGGVDSRGPVEHVTDSATEFGTNAIAQRLGDMIPGLIRKAPFVFKPNPTTGMTRADTHKAFRDVGLTPTAGQLTGRRLWTGTENLAAKSPGGSGTMHENANKQIGLLSDSIDELAAEYGGVSDNLLKGGSSPTEAGRALKTAAETFKTTFQNNARNAFDELGNYLPVDYKAAPDSTLRVLTQMGDEFSATPTLAKKLENPALRGYLEAIKTDMTPEGTIPFNTLKGFRSKIGRMISEPSSMIDPIPRAELKEVYEALSRDMEDAVEAISPEALQQFHVANKLYRDGIQTMENVFESVASSDTPERAFRYAMEGSGVRNGGGTRLRELRDAMDPIYWDAVSSSVLRRMGDANPGQQGAETVFSPTTFLTNWNKLAPEAKDALFRGSEYEDLSPKLDKLVKVMAAMKESQYMSNPSGTAGQNMFASLLSFGLGSGTGAGVSGLLDTGVSGASLMGGLGSVAGVTVAPYIWSKLLTSPRFVDWLADAGTQAAKGNTIFNTLPRLYNMAKTEPAIEQFIDAYFTNQQEAPKKSATPARPGLLN